MTDRVWPTAQKVRRSDFVLIKRVRRRAEQLERLNQAQFLDAADALRTRIRKSQVVLDVAHVVESFALTAEALRRSTGKIYYDVQLLGGLALCTGAIAEMQTGEGKTITTALPAVLYGLQGEGVHVATTNEYLAKRDHEELVPVFEKLGLTSALIDSEQAVAEKKVAYDCDITYGTGYEFGFDFLRDQLVLRKQKKPRLGSQFIGKLRGVDAQDIRLMQRNLAFAVIDEADSVLIDEATTPLILSGAPTGKPANLPLYKKAMQVADQLVEGNDFEFDRISNLIDLTDSGWHRIHEQLPNEIQESLQRPWSQYIVQSLKALLVLNRNVDYVVDEEAVVIVDQNTGRLHDERKWRSGLHQAVEVREGVELTEENAIEARITRQRFFQFYQRVCGMTGTATGNELELMEFYKLPVVAIPRNESSKRTIIKSRYFRDQKAKYYAISREVAARQLVGQPVLVGTRTITQSQEIAKQLTEANVAHTLLNGTQNEDESQVISRAGQTGSVTIATNMAGRGTDIRLSQQARESGGLHVIVAEHHASTRVDRQLIGRSARQADPGSCQFFVSAEDEIIQTHAPLLAKKILARTDDHGESHRRFDSEVRELQHRIEKMNFQSRQKMVLHDRWTESVQKAVAKRA